MTEQESSTESAVSAKVHSREAGVVRLMYDTTDVMDGLLVQLPETVELINHTGFVERDRGLLERGAHEDLMVAYQLQDTTFLWSALTEGYFVPLPGHNLSVNFQIFGSGVVGSEYAYFGFYTEWTPGSEYGLERIAVPRSSDRRQLTPGDTVGVLVHFDDDLSFLLPTDLRDATKS